MAMGAAKKPRYNEASNNAAMLVNTIDPATIELSQGGEGSTEPPCMLILSQEQ